MKKLTEAYPALTTGAIKPNHNGLEKWKRTILMAAKHRKPVNAFSRAGLLVSTLLLDVSGTPHDTAKEAGTRTPPGHGHLRSATCNLIYAGAPATGPRYSAVYAVTSDPTFSPSTTRLIFPGWFMLKIISGRSLSLQRLTAVRSITFRPWRKISM